MEVTDSDACEDCGQADCVCTEASLLAAAGDPNPSGVTDEPGGREHDVSDPEQTPDTDVEAPSPRTLIERFCRLQALVAEEVIHFESANDCFCGERQDWVDAGCWRNDLTAIEWIEKAVVEAIARRAEGT